MQAQPLLSISFPITLPFVTVYGIPTAMFKKTQINKIYLCDNIISHMANKVHKFCVLNINSQNNKTCTETFNTTPSDSKKTDVWITKMESVTDMELKHIHMREVALLGNFTGSTKQSMSFIQNDKKISNSICSFVNGIIRITQNAGPNKLFYPSVYK